MSSAKPISIRIPEETRTAIEEASRRTGRDFSTVANQMLSEAVKMRRIAGIVFVDSPSGRVARVAGTGIDVFEIVKAYREMGQDRGRLQSAYHWLSDIQLRAALAYAQAYPEEIEDRIALEKQWTPESVWEAHPFTRPEQGR
ncbi:MAG: hypothetical protein Q8R92_16635 [Deltaproteobacteria bacterium]|nr:hypothetical protein [Deltaproteobacteria bacterium]